MTEELVTISLKLNRWCGAQLSNRAAACVTDCGEVLGPVSYTIELLNG